MGARSSPEGYRVAAGRYGLPVRTRATARRRWSIVVLILLPIGVGACGSSGAAKSSKSSKSSKSAACTTVAKLDEIADAVAHADVSDPDTFNKTLQTAVAEYVANVRSLETVVPSDLRRESRPGRGRCAGVPVRCRAHGPARPRRVRGDQLWPGRVDDPRDDVDGSANDRHCRRRYVEHRCDRTDDERDRAVGRLSRLRRVRSTGRLGVCAGSGRCARVLRQGRRDDGDRFRVAAGVA